MVSIFWGLKFPFHYQRYQKTGRLRYIHTSLVISGILLPLIPALAPFAAQGYGFAFRYPPLVCTPFDVFVTVCLVLIPGCIFVFIGMFCLTVVFWFIVKQRRMTQRRKQKAPLTLPETKVLIVVCFFVFWVSLVIVGYTIFGIRRDEANEAAIIYYGCASFGISNTTIVDTCNRSKFEQAYFPALGIADALYIILALFPATNLVFIIDPQKMRKWCLKHYSQKRPRKVTSFTASSTL